MTSRRLSLSRIPRLRRFARDESGATLVEFALVVLLFLTLLFGIIDFGRLSYTWAATQKATQIAARIASVRPPACTGVPAINDRGFAGSGVSFGTLCRAGEGVCEEVEPVSCTGDIENDTVREIVEQIRPLLPARTDADNLRFTYSFDRNLGFLGGPYVPMVTVDLDCVKFEFATRLDFILEGMNSVFNQARVDAAERCANADDPYERGAPLPRMSVSVPGEDLAQGTAG